MKIEIELIEGAQSDAWNAGWRVTYEDKHTGSLAYDEMLGLVASITMPKEKRPCLNWLKTEEQHKEWNDKYPLPALGSPDSI